MNTVIITCGECKLQLCLNENTIKNMIVKLDANTAVIPCPNPHCKNNIPVSLGEDKDGTV